MLRITVLLVLILAISAQHLRRETGVTASGDKGSWWVGFLIGPLLFILAFPVIWYNERKASINAKHMAEAQQICKTYNPN